MTHAQVKKKRYLPLQTRFPGWLVATRGGWPPRPHLPDTRTWQTRTFLSSLLNSALLYPLCSQVTREVGVDWRFGAHLLLRVQPIFGFTYYCISSSSVLRRTTKQRPWRQRGPSCTTPGSAPAPTVSASLSTSKVNYYYLFILWSLVGS